VITERHRDPAWVTIERIARRNGVAGAYQLTVDVTYHHGDPANDDATTTVFVSSVYGAPVVMITPGNGTQMVVDDWRRYGERLDTGWVRAFYGIAAVTYRMVIGAPQEDDMDDEIIDNEPIPPTVDFTSHGRITRVELIDHRRVAVTRGRAFTAMDVDSLTLSLQDDGRTLKLFIS